MPGSSASPDQQPTDGDLATDTGVGPGRHDVAPMHDAVDDLPQGLDRHDDSDGSVEVPREMAVRHDPLARLEAVGASMETGRSGGSGRRRLDVKLLLASLGIAVGVVLVAIGLLRSVTGREQLGLPDPIESIDPIRGAAQVPQQTRVFVDLQIGYEAAMIIDGVELPIVPLDDIGKVPPGLGEGGGDQIEIPPGALWEPGNATLTFEPGPAQVIEAFDTGMHTVTVRYWRTEDGPDRFRTFSWTFYAV